MSISYDIDNANRIVFVSIPDTIAIDDIERLIHSLRKQLRFVKNLAMLIDARELKRAFLVREGGSLLNLITLQPTRLVCRYALVVNQDFTPGFSRKFLIKAKRQGIRMKTFKDHASALAWLKNS